MKFTKLSNLKKWMGHSEILAILLAVALFSLFQNCSSQVDSTAWANKSSALMATSSGTQPLVPDSSQSASAEVSINFSDSMSGALAGDTKTSFRLQDNVFGVVRGFGANNIWGCFAPINSMGCNNLANWTLLPNPAWHYNVTDHTWRMQQDFLWMARSAVGQHAAYVQDRSSGLPATIKIITLSCASTWVPSGFSIGPFYPPQVCSKSNIGAITSGGGASWTCDCR